MPLSSCRFRSGVPRAEDGSRWGLLWPRTLRGGWGGLSGMTEGRWAERSPEPTSTKTGLCSSPLVPPNIEPGPLNKAVLENASVTLECLASGVPPPGKTPPLGRKPSQPGPNSPSNEAGQRPRHRLGCGQNREGSVGPSPISRMFLSSQCVGHCRGPGPLHWCLKQAGLLFRTRDFTGPPWGRGQGPGPQSRRLSGALV